MIKGINKQMVMLALPPKSRFECAYFIVRHRQSLAASAERSEADGLELLAEASRILQDSGLAAPSRRDRAARRARRRRVAIGLLLFFAGVGMGALLALLLS